MANDEDLILRVQADVASGVSGIQDVANAGKALNQTLNQTAEAMGQASPAMVNFFQQIFKAIPALVTFEQRTKAAQSAQETFHAEFGKGANFADALAQALGRTSAALGATTQAAALASAAAANYITQLEREISVVNAAIKANLSLEETRGALRGAKFPDATPAQIGTIAGLSATKSALMEEIADREKLIDAINRGYQAREQGERRTGQLEKRAHDEKLAALHDYERAQAQAQTKQDEIANAFAQREKQRIAEVEQQRAETFRQADKLKKEEAETLAAARRREQEAYAPTEAAQAQINQLRLRAQVMEDVARKGGTMSQVATELKAREIELATGSRTLANEFRNLHQRIEGTENQMKQLGKSTQRSRGYLAAFTRQATAFFAAMVGYHGMRQIATTVRDLVMFNAEIEQARLAIATTISTAGRYVDSMGQALPMTQQMTLALQEGDVAFKKILKDSVELGINVDTTAQAFATAAGMMKSVGIEGENAVRIVEGLIIVGERLHIPNTILMRDMDNIVRGLNVQRTMLGMGLGLIESQVKEAIKRNTLEDLLLEKTEGALASAKLNLTTWKGITTAIGSAARILASNLTADAFEGMKAGARDFLDILKDMNKALEGTAVDDMNKSLQDTRDSAEQATGAIAGLRKEIGDWATIINNATFGLRPLMFAELKKSATGLLGFVIALEKSLYAVVKAFAGVFSEVIKSLGASAGELVDALLQWRKPDFTKIDAALDAGVAKWSGQLTAAWSDIWKDFAGKGKDAIDNTFQGPPEPPPGYKALEDRMKKEAAKAAAERVKQEEDKQRTLIEIDRISLQTKLDLHRISSGDYLKQDTDLQNKILDLHVSTAKKLAALEIDPDKQAAEQTKIAKAKMDQALQQAKNVAAQTKEAYDSGGKYAKIYQDIEALQEKAFGTPQQQRIKELERAQAAHIKTLMDTGDAGMIGSIYKVERAYAKMIEDAKAGTIDLRDTFLTAIEDMFSGVILGTRNMSDVFKAFEASIVKSFAKGFADALMEKLNFDAKMNVNFMQDLPDMAIRGANKIGQIFSNLFSLLSNGSGVGPGVSVDSTAASFQGGRGFSLAGIFGGGSELVGQPMGEAAIRAGLIEGPAAPGIGPSGGLASGSMTPGLGVMSFLGPASILGGAASIFGGMAGLGGGGLWGAGIGAGVGALGGLAGLALGTGLSGAVGLGAGMSIMGSAALAGSIIPIVGTLAGAIIGGILGSVLGDFFSSKPTQEHLTVDTVRDLWGKTGLWQSKQAWADHSIISRSAQDIFENKGKGKGGYIYDLLFGGGDFESMRGDPSIGAAPYDLLTGRKELVPSRTAQMAFAVSIGAIGGETEEGLARHSTNAFINNARIMGITAAQAKDQLLQLAKAAGVDLEDAINDINKSLLEGLLIQEDYNDAIAGAVLLFTDLPARIKAVALAESALINVNGKLMIDTHALKDALDDITKSSDLATNALQAYFNAAFPETQDVAEQQRQRDNEMAVAEARIRYLEEARDKAKALGDDVTAAEAEMTIASERAVMAAGQAAEKALSPQEALMKAIKEGLKKSIIDGIIQGVVQGGMMQVALAPVMAAIKNIGAVIADPQSTEADVNAAFDSLGTSITKVLPMMERFLPYIDRILGTVSPVLDQINNITPLGPAERRKQIGLAPDKLDRPTRVPGKTLPRPGGGTTPDGTTPDGTTPDGTTPGGTTPGGGHGYPVPYTGAGPGWDYTLMSDGVTWEAPIGGLYGENLGYLYQRKNTSGVWEFVSGPLPGAVSPRILAPNELNNPQRAPGGTSLRGDGNTSPSSEVPSGPNIVELPEWQEEPIYNWSPSYTARAGPRSDINRLRSLSKDMFFEGTQRRTMPDSSIATGMASATTTSTVINVTLTGPFVGGDTSSFRELARIVGDELHNTLQLNRLVGR